MNAFILFYNFDNATQYAKFRNNYVVFNKATNTEQTIHKIPKIALHKSQTKVDDTSVGAYDHEYKWRLPCSGRTINLDLF